MGRPTIIAIIFAAISVILPAMPTPSIVYAAARLPAIQSLAGLKGFVVSKGPMSMVVSDGRTTTRVIITPKTAIVGSRSSFALIAADDVVRVDGPRTAPGVIMASRVEILRTLVTVTAAHVQVAEPSDDSISSPDPANRSLTVLLR